MLFIQVEVVNKDSLQRLLLQGIVVEYKNFSLLSPNSSYFDVVGRAERQLFGSVEITFHLDRLCDDLVLLLSYLIIRVIVPRERWLELAVLNFQDDV